MRVLIVSPPSLLVDELVITLGDHHEVRRTFRQTDDASQDVDRPRLNDIEAARDVVRGIDVIVNNPEFDPHTAVADQLDASTLQTYNLLSAAADEGIRRVVHLSSLRVMEGFDDSLAVVEAWRPAPDADSVSLLHHLSEFVCREFAREALLDVVVLRLGDLVVASGDDTTSALSIPDAVQAVELALAADFGAGLGPEAYRASGHTAQRRLWNVFHIQSNVDGGRYSTAVAQEMLGFEPSTLSKEQR